MAVYRPTYTDKKTGEKKVSKVWWYDFIYAGKRIIESSKSRRKTLAAEAEKNRRWEMEHGFNAVTDRRGERIRTIGELADDYFEAYKLRHKSATFAEYALGHVKQHAGSVMVVDFEAQTVLDYQSARLREKAAPKSINEEVGFLLRLMEDRGVIVRAKLSREKSLKLNVGRGVGKAYTPEQKTAMLAAAKAANAPAIYPALMLALHAGMRDAEIKEIRWQQIDLTRRILTVGDSKTDAGEGRTIPLNSSLLVAMVDHAKWYTEKFGTIDPDWYVFPWGHPKPSDPTRHVVTFKTAWKNVRKKAGVTGRWHDNRHTMITDLAEGGAPDEVIRDIAGHVSKQMLKHYSHIRMEAKRKALEGLVEEKAVLDENTQKPNAAPQEVPKVGVLN
jgi:integrase